MKKKYYVSYLILFILFLSKNSHGQLVIGGSIPGAYDVAVGASGNIYATASSSGNIAIIKPNGTLTFISNFGNSDGLLIAPYSLGLDAEENIFVADRPTSRILKFTRTGNFLKKHVLPSSAYPEGLAVNSYGHVCVTSSVNNWFMVLDNELNTLFTVGASGNGDGQFNSPRGVAFDEDGNIYVADRGNNRIQIFDAHGEYKFQITTKGSGDLISPTKVEIYNSNLFVSDQAYKTFHIYNLDGEFIESREINSNSIGYTSFLGLTFDQVGNMLIPSINRISVLSPHNGTLLKEYGGRASADGALFNPKGISKLSNGDIVVADVGNTRIQILSNEGTFKRKFTIENSTQMLML